MLLKGGVATPSTPPLDPPLGFLLYCQSWRLNPRSVRKVKAFCNQASNTSSPFVWYWKVLKYLWLTNVNNIGLAQSITSSLRCQTEVFKIQGFVCKRFLPSPLPPPSFLFLVLAPFSTQTKHRKSHSWSFFASKPHRNACYAGYLQIQVNSVCQSMML